MPRSDYDPDDTGEDPSEYEGDQSNRPARKKAAGGRGSARRPSGARKPRTWVEVDEFGDPIPLDEEQTVRLRERALNLCLWHLGQRACTRKQLLEAMTKKGVPAEMAEAVIEQLVDYGYVNDASFADEYVRSRHESQRKAASAIRYELLRKGVDSDTIDEALTQVTQDSEAENARTLVERKLPSTRGMDRNKRTNRLVGMLARKGYSPGIAYGIVREALDAEPAED